MAKGYKLTSASGDGPKTCAFFFSDKGCRNGANCKFSHEKAAASASPAGAPSSHKKHTSSSPPSVSSSSVVSSESESDGEIMETKAGAYASLGKNEVDIRSSSRVVNPFLSAVNVPISAPPAHAVVQQPVKKEETPAKETPAKEAPAQPSTEKKKKKRKKKTQEEEDEAEPPSAAQKGTNNDNIFDLGKAETQPPHSAAKKAPPTNDNTPPAKKKSKKVSVATPQEQANTAPPSSSFRNLQLPIASFSLPVPSAPSTPAATAEAGKPSPRPPSPPQHEPAPPTPPLPLPTATPLHLKWKKAVIATRAHANYANAFNYERARQSEFASGISSPKDWTKSKPYGEWCANNPASIAMDCEMCETKCPVTGAIDPKALCRISVVNADDPSEVLLDTLVKPDWPVSNHRTFVNGISKSDLENVQFTLKHAQLFMEALCSDQTVVVGHAVHNDLLALRMVHDCNVDTAMLFTHKEETDGTPSLKNLAHGILKREMPDVHDSVNDARVALECADHYVKMDGKVEPIEKVFTRQRSFGGRLDSADTTQLLVHRLPTSTQPAHISEMFLAYTYVKPKNVPEIVFGGTHGKCNVEFSTKEHAELAYQSLVGEEREDKTGKKQKRVGLKGGGYVCVRKMYGGNHRGRRSS